MLVASRHFLLSLAALLCGICSVHGGVVTLYYVSAPTTIPTALGSSPTQLLSFEMAGTVIASAIGPGDAGMTRYEIQEVQSKLILHESQTTITLLPSPITYTYTLEQGATAAYHSAPPLLIQQGSESGEIGIIGMRQNCSLDISKNTGTCVEEDQALRLLFMSTGTTLSAATVTSTRTITGPLLPLATVTTSDANFNSRVMIMRSMFLFGATLAIAIF